MTTVNVAVQLGALNEQVTVEATTASLQTTKTDVNTSLDTESMENLPLSGYRNYQSLINLVPGATGFPQITATVSATTYIVPADQGPFGGATPAGPSTASSPQASTSGSSTAAPTAAITAR